MATYLTKGQVAVSKGALDLGVVVPTLNSREYLIQTLLSLKPLQARGARILIVDGGSSDGTREIAAGLGFRVHDDLVAGMYPALNVGFKTLECRWLTWINSDDVIYAETLLQRVRDAGVEDVLYGTVDFIDTEGRFVHSWRSEAPHRLLKLFRAGCSPLLQQGTIFRRTVYERLDGFSETFRLVADADFWWRALEHGFRFRRLSAPPVAGFRLHRAQASQANSLEMAAEHRRMARHHGGSDRLRSFAPCVMRYRLTNWRYYLTRVLRSRDLRGRYGLSKSYTADT